MKLISKEAALTKLRTLKDDLSSAVAPYETKAQPCSTCSTPGACCLDQHFVNVRISKLEAIAINEVINKLPVIRRAAVHERITNTAAHLTETNNATYACPLYEKGTGCLVHDEAKPVPCILHACYESESDLPPDELQNAAELTIDKLNTRVFGRSTPLEPLPIEIAKTLRPSEIADN